jgi:hypothetical protein
MSSSYLSPAAVQIVQVLIDGFIILLKIWRDHHGDLPFCPWLFSTEMLEHFFAELRKSIKDFTFYTMIKLVSSITRHVFLRKQYENFNSAKDSDSRSGLQFKLVHKSI